MDKFLFNFKENNGSEFTDNGEVVLSLVIVEGTCIGIGSVFILLTFIYLIMKEKLRTVFLLIQSQVNSIHYLTKTSVRWRLIQTGYRPQ